MDFVCKLQNYGSLLKSKESPSTPFKPDFLLQQTDWLNSTSGLGTVSTALLQSCLTPPHSQSVIIKMTQFVWEKPEHSTALNMWRVDFSQFIFLSTGECLSHSVKWKSMNAWILMVRNGNKNKLPKVSH